MKCPECAAEMERVNRERPAGGPVFIGEDHWVCPSCTHVEEVDDSRRESQS
jgi:uncharacterized protein with PIN domain